MNSVALEYVMSRLIKCLAVCLLGIAASGSAQASLGQKTASVDADRARFSAKMSTLRLVNYDRHELTLDSGTITREYVSGGVVFAVSWQGPVRPDLKQIFADYYPRFQADNVPAGRIRMRRALASTHDDFIVRTGGHSGAFWGYAYLPAAIPPSFTPAALTGTNP